MYTADINNLAVMYHISGTLQPSLRNTALARGLDLNLAVPLSGEFILTSLYYRKMNQLWVTQPMLV
jgi:hypothetical protein